MLRNMTEDEEKCWSERVNKLKLGTKGDKIISILMDTSIGGHGYYEEIARAKAKEIVKLFEPQTDLHCLSVLSMNYIKLRLSLRLVNMKAKPFDYFLDDLDQTIEELTKMNTYGDLYLEDNIKYLEKIRNMDRNDSKLIEKEIAKRKDSLKDYEHFVQKKIKKESE